MNKHFGALWSTIYFIALSTELNPTIRLTKEEAEKLVDDPNYGEGSTYVLDPKAELPESWAHLTPRRIEWAAPISPHHKDAQVMWSAVVHIWEGIAKNQGTNVFTKTNSDQNTYEACLAWCRENEVPEVHVHALDVPLSITTEKQKLLAKHLNANQHTRADGQLWTKKLVFEFLTKMDTTC